MTTRWYQGELQKLVSLATPLVFAHIGQHVMGLVDTAMLGRYSNQALAGSGIANGMLFGILMFGIGTVLALDALVPQAIGSGKKELAKDILRSGISVGWQLTTPLTIVITTVAVGVTFTSIPPDVAREAAVYTLSRAPTVFPILAAIACRSYLQANNMTKPIVLVAIVGNIINFVGNSLLIFGDASLLAWGLPAVGLPALGVLGAGISTTIVCFATMIFYGGYLRKPLRSARVLQSAKSQIWKVGLPLGCQLTAEVGIFAIGAVASGYLGKLAAAAHQIALSLATITFSAALGIGAATATRVGLHLGAGHRQSARQAAIAATFLALIVMGGCAALFVFGRHFLASLFSTSFPVVVLASELLIIAAMFQLVDGLQTTWGGALRGSGKTSKILIGNLIGHYGVALPAILLLGFTTSLGITGVWVGLALGLAMVALLLGIACFRDLSGDF